MGGMTQLAKYLSEISEGLGWKGFSNWAGWNCGFGPLDFTSLMSLESTFTVIT